METTLHPTEVKSESHPEGHPDESGPTDPPEPRKSSSTCVSGETIRIYADCLGMGPLNEDAAKELAQELNFR